MTLPLPGERVVAGLACGAVLDLLPDLLDGRLSPADAAAAQAHVHGCDVCARFGGEYAALVARARALPAPDGAWVDDLLAALDARL